MKRWGNKRYFYLEKDEDQKKHSFYSVEKYNETGYLVKLKNYSSIHSFELLELCAEKFIMAIPGAGQMQIDDKRVIFTENRAGNTKMQICSIYVDKNNNAVISTFKEYRLRLIEIFLWEIVFPELFKILFPKRNQ